SLTLPAGTAVLLPIGYELGHGVTIVGATVQLTGASMSSHGATLELWTPAGGELTVALPGPPRSTILDGKRRQPKYRARNTVQLGVPAGDHELALTWKPRRKHRRRPPARRARRS